MPGRGERLRCVCVMTLVLFSSAASRKRRSTFMQQAAGGDASSPGLVPSGLAPAGSLEKLLFIQNLVKNGFEPHDVMSTLVNGAEFQQLYKNAEVMHQILEGNPLLHAIDGFSQAAGRRLSDQDTTNMFQQGVKNLMELSKTTAATSKDPSSVLNTMSDLSKSQDAGIKAAFEEVKSGNQESLQKLQKIVAEKSVPGLDFDKMQEVADKQTFDAILNKPELMHFIDMDPHLSEIFRNGYVLPGKIKEAERARREEL